MAASPTLAITRAYEPDRDGARFALWSFDYSTQTWGWVTVEGRVLYFENRQRLRDFFGHLYGRGDRDQVDPLGSARARAYGRLLAANMEPRLYEPTPMDLPSAEYYRKHA